MFPNFETLKDEEESPFQSKLYPLTYFFASDSYYHVFQQPRNLAKIDKT